MRDFSASSIWNNMYDFRRKLHSTQSNYHYITAILKSQSSVSTKYFMHQVTSILKSGNKKAKTMRFKPETVRFWNMNDAI